MPAFRSNEESFAQNPHTKGDFISVDKRVMLQHTEAQPQADSHLLVQEKRFRHVVVLRSHDNHSRVRPEVLGHRFSKEHFFVVPHCYYTVSSKLSCI